METNNLFLAINLQDGTGITKKVNCEYMALKKGLDSNLDYISLQLDGLYYNNQKIDVCLKGIDKLGCYFNAITQEIEKRSYNLVYVRYVRYARPSFIHLLKSLKKHSKKIVMEIPTYPYDGEFLQLGSGLVKKTSQIIKYLIEAYYRRQFHKYIDYIVTFSEDENIFGVRTIKITNGLDLDSIELREIKPHDGINFVAVAKLTKWHGYDRLLVGLHDYVKEANARKIHLTIVGDSYDDTYSLLKKMSEDLGLQKFVTFVGDVKYEDLKTYFIGADIGIGSLGRHRCGIKTMATLKNREYAARGLPFVYSENDLVFDDKDFICKLPPDDSPINIQTIIDFYDKVSGCVPENIRATVKNLDWKNQMQIILNKLSD